MSVFGEPPAAPLAPPAERSARARLERHSLAYLTGQIGYLVLSVLVARQLGAAALGGLFILTAVAAGLSFLLGLNAGVGAYQYFAQSSSARVLPRGERAPPS